jgi:hypothetical protein
MIDRKIDKSIILVGGLPEQPIEQMAEKSARVQKGSTMSLVINRI